jgi:hypothetical protein
LGPAQKPIEETVTVETAGQAVGLVVGLEEVLGDVVGLELVADVLLVLAPTK